MMNHNIKYPKAKWAILLTLTIFIVSVRFAVSNQHVKARPQEDVTIVLAEKDDLSGVSYAIAVDNVEKELLAKIEYDTDSMEGINRYRTFNSRELAKILQNAADTDNIPLRITFDLPLSRQEFTEFVKQYEINVSSYYIYMLEANGNIVTIQGSPSEEALVPDRFFNAAANSVSQEYSPGARFLGWVEVDGMVEAKYVPQIIADRRVFMADAMQLFLESRLTDKTLADAGIVKNARRELLRSGFTDIDRGGLIAWNLYYLNLEDAGIQQ